MKNVLIYKEINIPIDDFHLKGNLRQAQNLKALYCFPMVLISGDGGVIELNKTTQDHINSICDLKIITGAKHLFPELGKLQTVAKETCDWFTNYLKT